MSTHLKKITARAKQIRKAKPSIKWTDAIKQASKQIGSAPVKKVAGVKKKAAKKVAKRVSKKHTDTKSHNVNIRVVSGAPNMFTVRDMLEKQIAASVKQYNDLKEKKRNKIAFSRWDAALYRQLPKIISRLKKQLRDQNAFINYILK